MPLAYVPGNVIPPLARRFVAGETAPEAIDRVRELDEDDVGTILNLLGEHHDDPGPAEADTDACCALLSDLATVDARACISVKPSQLGLDVGERVFRENLARIVQRAVATEGFVWLDMEDHTTTDATLDAYVHHAREHGTAGGEAGTVGVCVQANLERTREDVERLAGLPGKVRFVKGAYDPPAEIAYTDHERVNAAYRDLLDYAFTHFEDGIAVGSHDPAMIEYAARLHDEHGTPYEIQMLMGVREDAQRTLAADRDVWQYVPYGDRWLSYFYRRVAERKENALFAARAIVDSLR